MNSVFRDNKLLKKFYATFSMYPVSRDWQDELCSYVVYGLPSGSFHTALYSNNLVEAALRTHPLNTWSAIVGFMQWLANVAPAEAWGSEEKVKNWLSLSSDQRRELCEKAGVLASAWELLQE